MSWLSESGRLGEFLRRLPAEAKDSIEWAIRTFSLKSSWLNSKQRDQSFHYERLARAFAVDFYPKGQDYIIAIWETGLFCFVDLF